MSTRADKVAAAIQQEIQLILHEEMKDPRIGFVTITKVEMAADLRHGKVHFSVLGNADAYKKTKAALESASGFIRTLVTERINLKFSPEFTFTEDHSTEYSVHIQKIINQINDGTKEDSHGTE